MQSTLGRWVTEAADAAQWEQTTSLTAGWKKNLNCGKVERESQCDTPKFRPIAPFVLLWHKDLLSKQHRSQKYILKQFLHKHAETKWASCSVTGVWRRGVGGLGGEGVRREASARAVALHQRWKGDRGQATVGETKRDRGDGDAVVVYPPIPPGLPPLWSAGVLAAAERAQL